MIILLAELILLILFFVYMDKVNLAEGSEMEGHSPRARPGQGKHWLADPADSYAGSLRVPLQPLLFPVYKHCSSIPSWPEMGQGREPVARAQPTHGVAPHCQVNENAKQDLKEGLLLYNTENNVGLKNAWNIIQAEVRLGAVHGVEWGRPQWTCVVGRTTPAGHLPRPEASDDTVGCHWGGVKRWHGSREWAGLTW